MINKDMEIEKLFNEVISVTQSQIHDYPYSNFKRRLVLLAKTILTRKNYMNNKYFWPNGLLATSLEWCHRSDGNELCLMNLTEYYDEWIKSGAILRNTDYVLNGYSLIYTYEVTKNDRYLQTIEKIVNYVKSQRKTKIGSLPYRTNTPNNVLVDSLGMISPFLCRYGSIFNDEVSMELGIKQLTNFLKYGIDAFSKLPYHGYDAEEKTKLGIIGWGRAIGWLLIGLIDSLEFIPPTHKDYKYLCIETENIVKHVVSYQLSDGGFTWQIVAKEGHIDTSSISMICYAIRRGIMLGILPNSYLINALKGLNAIYENTVNGKVQNCSAECKGVGMYPQKYSNYPWAQGPATALIAITLNQEPKHSIIN